MRKILQIISADDYFLLVTSHSSYSRETVKSRYKVVAWALVEEGSVSYVAPLIVGKHSLALFDTELEWEICRD